jgi:hypothetical protein
MFTEGFMRGEEDAEGHEEQRSPFITSPKNKSGRWKNVIAQRAYDRKISNIILHPSTALISSLMPS